MSATSPRATSTASVAPRDRLIEIVREKSLSTGDEIKLASGKTSRFYFNTKPTMLDPEGAALISQLILERLADEPVDYVGGLEMGAVPLAACLAQASRDTARPLPAFFVRKKAKEHGAKLRVEGLPPGETLNGKHVVVLEDVTTTGGSSLQAIQQVRDEGGIVALAVTIVDRLEGAADTLADAGVTLAPLLTADDFDVPSDS